MPKEKKSEPKEPEPIFIPICTMATEDFLVEQVWHNKVAAFEIYYFDSRKVEIRTKIACDEQGPDGRPIFYVPITDDTARNGNVIIPESVTEEEIENATFQELWAYQDELLDLGFDAGMNKPEAHLFERMGTSTWFIGKEDTTIPIAGMGRFAPILAIRGLSGGGKNRLLNIMRFCSYHAFMQVTTDKLPSIFRPLEHWRGVLVMDEADIDVHKDSDVVRYLLCRSYGIPISRQDPTNIDVTKSFNNFQGTFVAQRKSWGDDNALEGRTIALYSEKSWKHLPTLETKEMINLGRKIQKLSLCLRFKYWRDFEIDRKAWLETSDARLNSALLPLLAISKIEPKVMDLVNSLLKKIERRKTFLKAQSKDGQIVNYLYEKVEKDGSQLFSAYSKVPGTYYFLERIDVDNTDPKEPNKEVEIPLTPQKMAQDLGWQSGKEIRQTIDGFMHLEGMPQQIKSNGKTFRIIFFRVPPLVKLFREFVPDFEPQECLPSDFTKSGLEAFDGEEKQSQKSQESHAPDTGVVAKENKSVANDEDQRNKKTNTPSLQPVTHVTSVTEFKDERRPAIYCHACDTDYGSPSTKAQHDRLVHGGKLS